MKEIQLDGLRVWLGTPVEVTAGIGWHMDWPHPKQDQTWSFVHLTPFMEKFPDGGLIATYTLDPDNRDNPVCVSGFQFSRDGGAHWGRRYSELMQHNNVIFLPKPNNSLLALPSEFMLGDKPGELVGSAYLFEHGGDRMVLVPEGVHIVDWKGQLNPIPSIQPKSNWLVGPTLIGSSVAMGKTILATGYFDPDLEEMPKAHHSDNVLFASQDGGYTWRYFSTIAKFDPAMKGTPWYEGPNESFMIRLADGDLMTVFRVGNGEHWKLRRNYSHDGGRTWSEPDILPAWSVRPIMVRMANGAVALTTGRPGLFLWLASDPRASRWQQVDLRAHHNAWARDLNLQIGRAMRPGSGMERGQSTSYTGLVELSPNRMLLCYDRDPEMAPASPKDLSHVFVLPIEVERAAP